MTPIPSVGDPWTFRPAANFEKSSGFGEILGVKVMGTIVQVNEEHRWFRVRYEMPYGVLHECFKF